MKTAPIRLSTSKRFNCEVISRQRINFEHLLRRMMMLVMMNPKALQKEAVT